MAFGIAWHVLLCGLFCASLALLEDAVPLVQVQVTPAGGRSRVTCGDEGRRHPWPTKNGNVNHSGYSAVMAHFDISKPSWVFTVPVGMHSSPVIDDRGNVYSTHPKLGVLSLDKLGKLRWAFRPPGGAVGNVALLGNQLFACSHDGIARGLTLESGRERWHRKIGQSCGTDAWVPSVVGTTAVLPTSVDRPSEMSCDIVSLNTTNGNTLWRYKVCKDPQSPVINMMPSISDDSVVVQDGTGSVHRVSLATGALQWLSPGLGRGFTTGGAATGPNDLVYSASNYEGSCDQGKGMIRALDLHTGKEVWRRTFPAGVNAGPAVGLLRQGGPLALVGNVGDNFLAQGIRASVINAALRRTAPVHRGTTYALDAMTGETMWSYDVEPFHSWTYPQQLQGCLPDAFGNPSISGDGTVYINWSGGHAYAVRDTNRDGQISKDEVSMVKTASGMNGANAISPGLLVMPSCDALRGYLF